jgi:hypothetical protein
LESDIRIDKPKIVFQIPTRMYFPNSIAFPNRSVVRFGEI